MGLGNIRGIVNGPTTAYHEDEQHLPALHPLWVRAYDDRGHTLLRERLDVMLEDH